MRALPLLLPSPPVAARCWGTGWRGWRRKMGGAASSCMAACATPPCWQVAFGGRGVGSGSSSRSATSADERCSVAAAGDAGHRRREGTRSPTPPTHPPTFGRPGCWDQSVGPLPRQEFEERSWPQGGEERRRRCPHRPRACCSYQWRRAGAPRQGTDPPAPPPHTHTTTTTTPPPPPIPHPPISLHTTVLPHLFRHASSSAACRSAQGTGFTQTATAWSSPARS